MANYLDYLYQRQRGNIQPGLLGGMGSASNGAAQLAQEGAAANAQAAQGAQRVHAAMQQNEAEAAQGLQQAVQRQAQEEANRQAAAKTLMSLALGSFGGGGEAAAGGAGTEATKAMANEAAEKAMLEVAPGMAVEKGMSLLGNYRDLGNAVGVTPYYDPRRLGLNFGF